MDEDLIQQLNTTVSSEIERCRKLKPQPKTSLKVSGQTSQVSATSNTAKTSSDAVMAAIKEIKLEVESLRAEMKGPKTSDESRQRNRRVPRIESHYVRHVKKPDRVAAHTALFVVPTTTFQLAVARDIDTEDTEGEPPVVQSETRSRQCSYCNKNINVSDELKRCSDCKIAFYCSRKRQKEQWPMHNICVLL